MRIVYIIAFVLLCTVPSYVSIREWGRSSTLKEEEGGGLESPFNFKQSILHPSNKHAANCNQSSDNKIFKEIEFLLWISKLYIFVTQCCKPLYEICYVVISLSLKDQICTPLGCKDIRKLVFVAKTQFILKTLFRKHTQLQNKVLIFFTKFLGIELSS